MIILPLFLLILASITLAAPQILSFSLTITVVSLPPPQLPGCDHDVSQWDSSQQQKFGRKPKWTQRTNSYEQPHKKNTKPNSLMLVAQMGVKKYCRFQNWPIQL